MESTPKHAGRPSEADLETAAATVTILPQSPERVHLRLTWQLGVRLNWLAADPRAKLVRIQIPAQICCKFLDNAQTTNRFGLELHAPIVLSFETALYSTHQWGPENLSKVEANELPQNIHFNDPKAFHYA